MKITIYFKFFHNHYHNQINIIILVCATPNSAASAPPTGVPNYNPNSNNLNVNVNNGNSMSGMMQPSSNQISPNRSGYYNNQANSYSPYQTQQQQPYLQQQPQAYANYQNATPNTQAPYATNPSLLNTPTRLGYNSGATTMMSMPPQQQNMSYAGAPPPPPPPQSMSSNLESSNTATPSNPALLSPNSANKTPESGAPTTPTKTGRGKGKAKAGESPDDAEGKAKTKRKNAKKSQEQAGADQQSSPVQSTVGGVYNQPPNRPPSQTNYNPHNMGMSGASSTSPSPSPMNRTPMPANMYNPNMPPGSSPLVRHDLTSNSSLSPSSSTMYPPVPVQQASPANPNQMHQMSMYPPPQPGNVVVSSQMMPQQQQQLHPGQAAQMMPQMQMSNQPAQPQMNGNGPHAQMMNSGPQSYPTNNSGSYQQQPAIMNPAQTLPFIKKPDESPMMYPSQPAVAAAVINKMPTLGEPNGGGANASAQLPVMSSVPHHQPQMMPTHPATFGMAQPQQPQPYQLQNAPNMQMNNGLNPNANPVLINKPPIQIVNEF